MNICNSIAVSEDYMNICCIIAVSVITCKNIYCIIAVSVTTE